MVSLIAMTMMLGMAQTSYGPPAVPPPPAPPGTGPAAQQVVLPAPAPLGPPASIAVHAQPRIALSSLVIADDYPVEALRAHAEGTVEFMLDIGANGRVADCRISRTSGSAALDSTTCRLMTSRARFIPASDPDGRLMPDTYAERIAWRIEQPPAVPPPPAPPGTGPTPPPVRQWAAPVPPPPPPEVRMAPRPIAPPADDVARGDLYSMSDARLTIARDGSILECRVVRRNFVGGGNTGTPPNPCLDWYPRMRLYAPAAEGTPNRFVDVTVRSHANHSIRRLVR